jgi:hypothetical protein
VEIIAHSTQKYLNFLHPAYVSAVSVHDIFGITEVQLLMMLYSGAAITILVILISYYLIKTHRKD